MVRKSATTGLTKRRCAKSCSVDSGAGNLATESTESTEICKAEAETNLATESTENTDVRKAVSAVRLGPLANLHAFRNHVPRKSKKKVPCSCPCFPCFPWLLFSPFSVAIQQLTPPASASPDGPRGGRSPDRSTGSAAFRSPVPASRCRSRAGRLPGSA